MADDYWAHYSADDRIREVRELLSSIDKTRPADMDQMFYMRCHDELVLAVRDLLDVIDGVDRSPG